MKADQIQNSSRVGYGLLLLYFVVAFLLRNHQTFVDEGTNLSLGWCVLNGYHLYRDIFETHFPLPVYLTAGLIFLTGTSMPLVRLAVLLLDAAMLLAAMRVSRLYLPVGFAAAVWAFISPYYFGSLLLYDNLAMVGGMALGAVCFAAHARNLEPSRGVFALLAVAGFLATMSNPFFALVTAIAIGSLFFAPRIPPLFVVKLSLTIAAPILAYFTYLAITGGLIPFYSSAVIFNSTTYKKYSPLPILPLIGKQLLFFNIFNSDWWKSVDPLRFNPVPFSPIFDQWIFSGLFYRLAVIASCALFLWRRMFKMALFLYLFVAALPLRGDELFHAAPFVLYCLFLVGVWIEESLSFTRPFKILTLALFGAPTLVLTFSGVRYLSQHALQSDFDVLTTEAAFIKQAAQNQPDVRLGHYPDGSYAYYLAGLRPVTRYVDYYPWVADIGRQQVDADIARAPKVVLVMNTTGNVWNLPNYITLGSEIAYADRHLVKEKFGWLTVYVSPSLAIKERIDTESKPAVSREHQSGLARFKPGLYRNGEWRLLSALGGAAGAGTRVFHFGQSGDLPVTGDWDGSGKTRIGVYRPSTGEWLLDYNGNGQADAGDKQYRFGGQPGDLPVTGDWDGSGKIKIGIYRPSTGEWLLDFNGDGVFQAAQDKKYKFGGSAGDQPVVGDWTGSGVSNIGIVQKDYHWFLDTNGNGRMDAAEDAAFYFGGVPGDVLIAGDWSGDGRTKPGIFRTQSTWLLDMDGNYQFDYSGAGGDVAINFGSAGDKPVTGAW